MCVRSHMGIHTHHTIPGLEPKVQHSSLTPTNTLGPLLLPPLNSPGKTPTLIKPNYLPTTWPHCSSRNRVKQIKQSCCLFFFSKTLNDSFYMITFFPGKSSPLSSGRIFGHFSSLLKPIRNFFPHFQLVTSPRQYNSQGRQYN